MPRFFEKNRTIRDSPNYSVALWIRLLVVAALIAWALWSERQRQEGAYWLNPESCFPDSPHYPLLLIALVLMPINWLLETHKWRALFTPDSRPSLALALKALAAGLTAALATPHRIGEYLGRLWVLPAALRVPGLTAGAIASLCNQLVIGAAGIIGVWGMASRAWDCLADPRTIQTLAILMMIGLLALFFSLPALWPRLLGRLPDTRTTRPVVKILQKVVLPESKRLYVGLGWAALRYAIYTGQFVAIVWFFHAPESPIQLVFALFSLFFFQTLLPLPLLAGLAARGALSLKLLGACGIPPCACLASSYLLWILNLFFPALLGTFFLFSSK